jgi:hypothetical protein
MRIHVIEQYACTVGTAITTFLSDDGADLPDIGFPQFSLLPLYSLVIPAHLSDPGISVTHKQASFACFP